MNFQRAMMKKLAADALERVGPNHCETQVVGSIYVSSFNRAAYNVTADGVEYGPFDYADALLAIVQLIETRLRQEQQAVQP
jgi:hypothetical protein